LLFDSKINFTYRNDVIRIFYNFRKHGFVNLPQWKQFLQKWFLVLRVPLPRGSPVLLCQPLEKWISEKRDGRNGFDPWKRSIFHSSRLFLLKNHFSIEFLVCFERGTKNAVRNDFFVILHLVTRFSMSIIDAHRPKGTQGMAPMRPIERCKNFDRLSDFFLRGSRRGL
jgi:hypothetical protein